MSSPYAPPGATPDPYGRPEDSPASPLEDDIERSPESTPVAEPEAATGHAFPPETGSATSQGESGGAVEQVKEKANEAAGTAKDEAAGVVEDAKASASDVLGTTASEAGKVATEAKDQAGSLLNEAAHAVREQSATGKDRAATGLRALSGELSSLADGAQEPGMAADLARQAGDRLGGAASWLEDRDIDGVLEDVQDFARRRPLTFLAIAVGAGVVVGRLARALKDAPSTPAARPAVDRSAVTGGRTPGSYGTPAVGALGVAPLPGRHAVGDTLSSPADALAVDPETAAPNRPGSPVVTDPYGATPPPVTTDDSLGSIVGRLTADVSTLVRQEIALARAEVTQDVKHASKGAGMFAGAGVAGHFVLMFLSIAAWWGLGYLIGNAWSAVVVAVVWAIVALVLYTVGKKQLAAADGIPQTAETVSKIPNALKGHQETS